MQKSLQLIHHLLSCSLKWDIRITSWALKTFSMSWEHPMKYRYTVSFGTRRKLIPPKQRFLRHMTFVLAGLKKFKQQSYSVIGPALMEGIHQQGRIPDRILVNGMLFHKELCSRSFTRKRKA